MASLFRPAGTLLNQYAEVHRDRRNIATHLVGVPMIVFGVAVLLVWPLFVVAGFVVTLAGLVFAAAGLWYLTRGELALGMATTASMALLVAAAHAVSGGGVASQVSWGLGMFLVGWVIQFIGHYYEGRKPAFADDVVGLLVSPMFVVLELLALLGLFKRLIDNIEQHAGPTHLRNLAHPALR